MAREYKDSGIEWIGRIPKEWKCAMFKHFYNNANVGESIDKIFCTDNNADLLFYTAGQKPIHTIYKDFPLWKYTNKNDLLLARNGTPYVYLPKQNAVYSDHIIRIDIKNNYNKRFIRYCIQQAISTLVVDTVSIPTWSISLWDKQIIPLPPLSEQQQIADFLDKKCGEIDALIALQEQMIAQLTDYKQSVINEAVTKGLDPNATLVPSGIDWIDVIPNGWRVCRIKDMVNLQSGTNLTTMDIADTGIYPVFGGNGLRGYYHQYSNDGDYILIGRQGALCGNINYASGKFWATEHAVVCYPKREFARKWFGELLRAMNLGQYSLSAAQPGLAVERIKNIEMPLPPLSEQHAIASYLDTKCSEIDTLIALKQQKKETLKDYKKSMIYECVTGKTDIL